MIVKTLKHIRPHFTESVNEADTQQVALLSFTWHRQHTNVHQLFKPIGERSAGKIKPEFFIVVYSQKYLHLDMIETWSKCQDPKVCQYQIQN